MLITSKFPAFVTRAGFAHGRADHSPLECPKVGTFSEPMPQGEGHKDKSSKETGQHICTRSSPHWMKGVKACSILPSGRDSEA